MIFHEIPADLADWTKAPAFPLSVETAHGNKAILLGVIGKFVVGAFWHGDEPEKAWSVQPLHWSGHGGYSDHERGRNPTLDLPPPPAEVGKEIERLQLEQGEIQQRLDAHPDAPSAWRATDEAKLRHIADLLANLLPESADQ